MEEVKGQCFVCDKRLTDHSTTPDGGEDAELETTVFLLRKVLQVPDPILESFLKGTPSDCGLGICQDCRPLLAECRAVHEELCLVKRKWSEVKAKVVNKMKVTAASPEGDEVSPRGDEDVRKQTRRSVVNHLNDADESRPLPSAQDHQGKEAPKQSKECDRDLTNERSNAPNHYVVIEQVVEVDKEEMPPKSHECLFCPAKYRCRARLENHLWGHTGERPFWCGVCGKECPRKDALNLHQLIHTGEKPHECNLCEKRFRDRKNLNRHVRAHLGEKPCKCPDCGKAFGRKAELTQHRRVHTGEKPFKCDLCGRRFSQRPHLTYHKQRLHSVKSRK